MQTVFLTTSCLALCATLLSSCSSSKTKNEKGEYQIRSLVPYNIHARRPPGLGADPSVTAGGVDYQSDPLPNEQFDCVNISELYKQLNLVNLRECFKSFEKPVSVTYRLRRAPAPYFEIQKEPPPPSCLKKLLPEIPVPREIFFQTTEVGQRFDCYNSRLPLEADEFLWVKMPLARKELVLRFPLGDVPSSDEKTHRLLLTWILAPFWEGKPPAIQSKYVPQSICRSCMGEKEMIQESSPPVELWP